MTMCFASSDASGVASVLFCLALLLAVIFGIVLSHNALEKMRERLADARDDYAQALERLSRKPTAVNRRMALACGRELLDLIEEAKTMKVKVPRMTEMTIQNDLQAAADGR